MSVFRNGHKIPPPADSIRHAISEAVIWPNLVPFRASFGSGRNKRLTNCSQNFSVDSNPEFYNEKSTYLLVFMITAVSSNSTNHMKSSQNNGKNNNI